ncbi:uncharacterized protein LOC126668247 [Mercurialis annua]|uniref:uncharacterized protein LOC126668247 n=1 Tax=Mercurialis annua TaxID=3986 RepID=UPI00215FB74D|nr:uncharacterized protein LOC126668247 [Mercurialis annua]
MATGTGIPLGLDTNQLQEGGFLAWANLYRNRFDNDNIEYFWRLCWAIWFSRNQLCFNSNAMPWDIVLRLARNTLFDFQQINSASQKSSNITVKTWSRPEEGWIKLNTDAGNFRDGFWGMGCVSRDSAGQVMMAGCVKKQTGSEIIMAEAEALLWGLKAAKDCSFSKIIVESDNATLISALQNETQIISELGDVLDNIRVIASCFVQLQWRKVSRDANKLAHGLAAAAVIEEEKFWIDDLPVELQDIWNSDLQKGNAVNLSLSSSLF